MGSSVGRAGLLLALPLLLAAPLGAQSSQGVLRGRVVERSSGHPVTSAEVAVSGRSESAITSSDGAWILSLPAGSYTLRVRGIGYAPTTSGVSLAGGDTVEVAIRLAASALPLDEIVVTASRREQRLADVTVPTEIITRETIEATGASNLAAALTEQTGIQFDGGHPSGAGVMLQGLSNERVLVLVDGQPLYGRISGTLDLARLPTSMVERVGVV